MNEIQKMFNGPFGQVRTVIGEDGNPLFCGKDIATILGYTRTDQAIRVNCRYPYRVRVPHPQSLTQQLEMVFIPEPDVYRLITRSKLPQAQQFEEWVYEDVLPSIRKHGAYITDEKLFELESFPDNTNLLINTLKQERQGRILYQEQFLEEQAARIQAEVNLEQLQNYPSLKDEECIDFDNDPELNDWDD